MAVQCRVIFPNSPLLFGQLRNSSRYCHLPSPSYLSSLQFDQNNRYLTVFLFNDIVDIVICLSNINVAKIVHLQFYFSPLAQPLYCYILLWLRKPQPTPSHFITTRFKRLFGRCEIIADCKLFNYDNNNLIDLRLSFTIKLKQY